MNGNREGRWLLLIYAATVFVSAFLLFQIQPLISKRILPWFGGSPAVWTACMLFFQAMLFIGYAFAHVAHRTLRPRWQALAHLGLLVAALAMARIDPSPTWKPLDASLPTWRILALLTACVGLPYFALATTGPLLQAWYSRAFVGRNPYRLYALSNLGSLLALVSYPLWFEPRFPLSTQATVWFGAFVVFVTLAGITGFCSTARRESEVHGTIKAADKPAGIAAPGWTDRILWLTLPAFGSIMLLATTNHACHDLPVVPMLWVVPLTLYLLSFVVAFDHPRWYRPWGMSILAIVALYMAAAVQFLGLLKNTSLYNVGHIGPYLAQWSGNFGLLRGENRGSAGVGPQFQISFVTSLFVYFGALMLVCLVCHGQLARLRPAPRYLTSYYLAIAAGGAVGGLFVTLLAPQLFTTYMEWKLGIVAAYVALMALVFYYWPWRRGVQPYASRPRNLLRGALMWGVLMILAVGLFDVITFLRGGGEKSLVAVRNFFGTITVAESGPEGQTPNGYVLRSGRIAHGFQFRDPSRQAEPTTYYGRQSGVGRALDVLSQRKPRLRVGTVGLGVGTLAAYAGPGSHYCFYEFNPAVELLARDRRFFTYLAQHADQVEVVSGDARLSLERQPPQRFDLLVLDAFSGDAIPTHLLTQEAFETYDRHLATRESDGVDGSVAVHISNKYLDLRPVVASAARQLGLRSVVIESSGDAEQMTFRARWMVLSRDVHLLDQLRNYENDPLPARPPIRWSDDHSGLFELLVR